MWCLSPHVVTWITNLTHFEPQRITVNQLRQNLLQDLDETLAPMIERPWLKKHSSTRIELARSGTAFCHSWGRLSGTLRINGTNEGSVPVRQALWRRAGTPILVSLEISLAFHWPCLLRSGFLVHWSSA